MPYKMNKRDSLNKPKRAIKAQVQPVVMRPSGPKTEMRPCRNWPTEFCRSKGCDFNSTAISDPPWWIIRYHGKYWGKDRWNYLWIDYGGPPKVFLTKRMASKEAKAFRKQYGRGERFGGGPLKVEVIKLIPNA